MKRLIIGLLTLLLGLALTGCSALRLGYANGSQLAWWWIDGYFDFSRDQTPPVKLALDQWFDWHRATQLTGYVTLLAGARQAVLLPTTAAAACAWKDRAREQLEPAVMRAMADFADVVPTLGEAQFRHLERRYAKVLDEMRADFLQTDAAERQRQSLKRAIERAERFYGPPTEAQLRIIEAGVAASPFNPDGWLVERQRRQRDAVQTLRRLVAQRADRDSRVAALRGLVQRTERSPDPDYRAYQVRLTDYNCVMAAQIHNAATPAQRQQASDNLLGWENDLRSLLVPAASAASAASGG